MIVFPLLVLGCLFFGLLYSGRGYWALVILAAGSLAAAAVEGAPPAFVEGASAAGVGLAILFGVRPLRRAVVTSWVMPLVGRMLPKMGATEKVALEAGTVWWDGELFSGDPDWAKLLAFPKKTLTEREEAFLSGD